MMMFDRVLYTAKVHTTGGRDGASRSSDDRLDVKLSSPAFAGHATNPEQLFAAGWSACFLSAMKLEAGKMKVIVPSSAAIDAEVDLCATGDSYFLQARLGISLPGLDHEVAQALVHAAHQTCPYCKATRGNVVVALKVVESDLVSVDLKQQDLSRMLPLKRASVRPSACCWPIIPTSNATDFRHGKHSNFSTFVATEGLQRGRREGDRVAR
jgi:osmotically inducible protein OsmC